MSKIASLFALLTFPFQIVAADNVEDTTWMQHADIINIRAIYRQINSHHFDTEYKECELYGGNLLISATLYKDTSNQVRKYVVHMGADDSIGDAEYYYSEHGVNVFSFIVRRAINGTHFQRRLYFNQQGKMLHEDFRLLQGPGYPQSLVESVANPLHHFSSICKEITE